MIIDRISFAKDQERLAALRSYRILDTPPEQIYDDITRIAEMICQTPIALMSLVDADRQWSKSAVGLETREAPISVSFCAHAIMETGVLVVPDTLRDDRFNNNPLVTGSPHIRFYAGAPIISQDGHPLGTVCVIDRRPRLLHRDQLQTLQALARQVVASLELRRAQLSPSRPTLPG